MGLLEKGASKTKKPTSPHVETKLDEVFKEVQKRKKLSLDEFTKICKTNSDEAEKWAKLLEAQGLLKVTYPLVGKPLVVLHEEKNTSSTSMSKKQKLLIFSIMAVVVVTALIFVLIRSFQ